MRRLLAAAAVVLLLSGCAPREMHGHATVVSQPDFQRDVALPAYLSYSPGSALADITQVGLKTTFPADPDWLTLSGDGDDSIIIDMSDEGCSLVLHHGSGADIGFEFTEDDAVNTVATLVAYLGDDPLEAQPIRWLANDGTVAADALAFVVTNDSGERVVGVARAFGSLDAYVYYELSCDLGVVTEQVLADRVGLYVSMTLA